MSLFGIVWFTFFLTELNELFSVSKACSNKMKSAKYLIQKLVINESFINELSIYLLNIFFGTIGISLSFLLSFSLSIHHVANLLIYGLGLIFTFLVTNLIVSALDKLIDKLWFSTHRDLIKQAGDDQA